jgi:predicted transcriptional regulator
MRLHHLLACGHAESHAQGVKTAVSIPDDVFEAAERLAKRLNMARSALHAEAVAQYLARHDTDAVTEAMNAACDAVAGAPDDRFLRSAARRVLERTEW